jgi:two-component system, NtrC family, sensor kinase
MNEIDDDYVSAIADHLTQESEESLSHAYELGRRALAQQFGLLDILSLYEFALNQLVLTAPVDERSRIGAATANFFREFLGPFEMSFRGYREANDELRILNEDLRAAYTELQAKQLQLIQSAKMASLGELVAGIAHEINNPLAFVLSHLSTISKSLDMLAAELGGASLSGSEHWQRARNRLTESQLGLERIGSLVLRLRTFSRLDEGDEKQVSIRECILSVVPILEHRMKDRIALETHFGEPDTVLCYPSLLNQAIMNLLTNAIDAIDGSGAIRITTGAIDSWFVIVVRDTGHGIPADLRPRVIEPFFTTKPVGQGTGLGLSITHSIVEKHRGTLELAPAEGGGTVATIRFPLIVPTDV